MKLLTSLCKKKYCEIIRFRNYLKFQLSCVHLGIYLIRFVEMTHEVVIV